MVFYQRALLLVPACILYIVTGLLPFAYIVQFSFSNGLENYKKVITNPLLPTVIGNTITISTLSTIFSVAIGYLLAVALWRTTGWARNIILGLVLLPFWTGALIKLFGWAALLHDHGAINELLQALGLTTAPVALLHTRFAVVFGMVHHCIPYAVFPIFTAMLSIGPQIERAAESLGASRLSSFRHVVLPLTLPGVYASALLVFIISLGFYLTPIVLGSPREMMIANLVDFYAHEIVDLGGASALAVLVVAAVSVLVAVYLRLPKEGQYGSQ